MQDSALYMWHLLMPPQVSYCGMGATKIFWVNPQVDTYIKYVIFCAI